MNLKLSRDDKGVDYTRGKLSINGEYECEIMEDAVRNVKIPGKTAIPSGTYKIIISWSPRFGQMMPLLLNVPNYMGVRIHPLNLASQTEGCLGPGTMRGKIGGQPAVLNSKVAYKKLFAKLLAASKKEEITITIE